MPCLLAFSPFPLRKMRNRKLGRQNSYFRSSLEETILPGHTYTPVPAASQKRGGFQLEKLGCGEITPAEGPCCCTPGEGSLRSTLLEQEPPLQCVVKGELPSLLAVCPPPGTGTRRGGWVRNFLPSGTTRAARQGVSG